jgi:surface antigen
MTLQDKALEEAVSQIGVQEDAAHTNRGPKVSQYLASVGLGPGYSWCMAFMYWCFNQAAEAMGRQNPLYKTGGVLEQWRQRKDQYRVTMPQPGDIMILDFGKGEGHTGIVEKVEADIIHTIEGNTNDNGSRDGYEVCRRTRSRAKVLGYLRFQ